MKSRRVKEEYEKEGGNILSVETNTRGEMSELSETVSEKQKKMGEIKDQGN